MKYQPIREDIGVESINDFLIQFLADKMEQLKKEAEKNISNQMKKSNKDFVNKNYMKMKYFDFQI